MRSRSSAEPFAARRAAGAASREATRQRLLTAADELFRERGYAATTVSAIAERSGTSLQTLYLAWGSKTALFRAAADATATASGLPLTTDAWRERIEMRLQEAPAAADSASAYLEEVAKVFTEVASRSIVYWRMQPAAAAADPVVAEGYAAAMDERRVTMMEVAARIPSRGLRSDIDRTYVWHTLWAIASPETFALLTGSGGYTEHDYERWLRITLVAALCGFPSADRGGSATGEPDRN